MRWIIGLAALVLAAGCSSHRLAADSSVHVSPALPASPATWPAYPSFLRRSCWSQPVDGPPSRPLRSAPSYAVSRPGRSQEIVRRTLARFGDRRYVLRIRIGRPPPVTAANTPWYGKGGPPRGALWAFLTAPEVPPRQGRTSMLAIWEANLVFGSLRDGFCAAGGGPLVGWSISGDQAGVSQGGAFGERFPNPQPAAYRRRVATIGRRYGFRVVSLRLLRPDGIAPLLVVRTDRARTAFARDVPAMESLLDPASRDGRALTFEGFFFEARDGKGPFVRTSDLARGDDEQGQWARDPCWDPFAWPRPYIPGGSGCPPGSTG